MAKISISHVFKRHRKIRILTLVALLLVSVAFGQMILFQGKKLTRASQSCHITSGGVIPAACTDDVIIDNTTVDVGGVRVWQSDGTHTECKIIGSGAYLGRRPSDNYCIYLNGGVKYEAPSAPVAHSKGAACDVTEGTASGYGVIDSVNEPTCDSVRHFKSLTVINNAVLTHSALATSDMSQAVSGSLAGVTSGYARWKQVNITVDNDITLDSGGKIDVSAKGYPVADVDQESFNNGNSYGPGGGRTISVNGYIDNAVAGGSGGGFGGNGGLGAFTGWSATGSWSTGTLAGGSANPGSFDASNPLFDFGSAGGNGVLAHYGTGLGGAGGGRVHLNTSGRLIVNTGSSVTANGANSAVQSDSHGKCFGGGGGAGGAIWLEARGYSLPASLAMSVDVNTGGGVNTTRGDSASGVHGSFDVSGLYVPNIISAKGGDAASPYNGIANRIIGGGGGGGGRIVVERFITPSVTISKTLSPVSRPNISPANAFNPYALQINDRIGVDLLVAGLVPLQPVTVTDDLLSNKLPVGATICDVGIGDTTSQTGLSNYSFSLISNSVVWTFTPTSTSASLGYQCTIH